MLSTFDPPTLSLQVLTQKPVSHLPATTEANDLVLVILQKARALSAMPLTWETFKLNNFPTSKALTDELTKNLVAWVPPTGVVPSLTRFF